MDEILSVVIQKKAIEQYFPLVLFMLHNVVVPLEAARKILMCDHSIASVLEN